MKSKKSRKKKKRKKVDLVRLLCTCGKRVKVSLKFAGKVGTCPKCGAQMQIPTQEEIDKVLGKNPQTEDNAIDFDIPSLPSLKEIVLDGSEKPPQHITETKKQDLASDLLGTKDFQTSPDLDEFPDVVPESLPDFMENSPDFSEAVPDFTADLPTDQDLPEAALAIEESLDFSEEQDGAFGSDNAQQVVAEPACEQEPEWEAMPVEEEIVEDAIEEEAAEALPVEVDIESFEAIEELEELEEDSLGSSDSPVYQAEIAEEVEEAPEEDEINMENLDSKIMIVEESPSDAMDAISVSEKEEQKWEERESSALLEESIEEQPICGGETLIKGQQSLEAENLDEALQYFCRCISSQEDLAAAYYLRAILYLKKKAWSLAAEDLENARICGYNEEDVERRLNQTRFKRAAIHRNTGAYSEALADLEQIMASNVYIEKGKVYWTRAKFLMRCQAWEMALEDIEKAIQHHHLKPQVYEAGGKISLRRKDYDSAMNYFSASINRGGNNAKLYHMRAEANFFLENFEDALSDVRQAQQRDPENSSIYDLEALILNEQQKYQEADKAFERSFGLDPDTPSHHFNRGVAYMRREKYSQAIEDFSRVLQIDSQDQLAYLKRAICYQEKTNPNLAQAREDFKKVEKLEREIPYRGG